MSENVWLDLLGLLPEGIGKWLLVFLLAVPFTWGGYLSVMHLKAARRAGVLTPASKVLGYPWLIFFMLVDVLFNIVIGTVIFLELPRELLFTSRVSRLNDRGGWRGGLAKWFCRELLDPFDPSGRHCS